MDKESGKNTSYALVTMANEQSMQAVLAAEVMAGDRLLSITPYKAKVAASSSGAMARMKEAEIHIKESEEATRKDEFAAQIHDKYGELVDCFNDGGFFGEEALLDGDTRRQTSVVAVVETEIWYIDRATAKDFSNDEEGVDLFLTELKRFAKKRQAQQRKQVKNASELNKRLEMISTQYRLGDLMLTLEGCQPRVPLPVELCHLDAAFSRMTLPDVRESIRCRSVTCTFANGVSLGACNEALRTGVFVLLSGLMQVHIEAEKVETVASAATRLTQLHNPASGWSAITQQTAKAWQVLQPGAVFSFLQSVQKVEGTEPGKSRGGVWVQSAMVGSASCTVLWIPLALFDFAHEPTSMDDSVTARSEPGDGSDDSDDEVPIPSPRDVRVGPPVDHEASAVRASVKAPEGHEHWHAAIARLEARLDAQEQAMNARQDLMDTRHDELRQLMDTGQSELKALLTHLVERDSLSNTSPSTLPTTSPPRSPRQRPLISRAQTPPKLPRMDSK
eukprot:COSAG01_NODE_142_length_24198_cov_8.924893_8_plen_504_part_00